MWKWLRSWFAWRFSLQRLVIATVFLGVIVGLNMRTIGPMRVRGGVCYYRGWPLPLVEDTEGYKQNGEMLMDSFRAEWNDHEPMEPEGERIYKAAVEKWHEHIAAAEFYSLPRTHRTYLPFFSRQNSGSYWPRFGPDDGRIPWVKYAIVDVCTAIALAILLLFLQIPRRKEPVRAGG